ncbi:DNA-processing protein DprA [bacterium]|nr:DNA-processing protein DprA [bacterium]
MMCSRDARFWLNLLSIEGITVPTWIQLNRRISLEKISGMLKATIGRRELGRLIGKRVGRINSRFVEKQLGAVDNGVCRILTISDKGYPELLKEIQYPPPVLFCKGDISRCDNPKVCIVGSRSCTRRGMLMAKRLGRGLSERGVVAVSGMARGIDTAVHEGALESNGGTIAVLGCGIDIAYPPENASLAIDISKKGCLMTEFPVGTPPLKYHFPRRNRILSGISLGVVVVEAGIKSGAMLTVGWAAEQGREVFAVPGPVESKGSSGPHKLIRDGAVLVERIEDILGVLMPLTLFQGEGEKAIKRELLLSKVENKVLEALELEPKHVDEIALSSEIKTVLLLPILLKLEMKGLCKSFGAGLYAAEVVRYW